MAPAPRRPAAKAEGGSNPPAGSAPAKPRRPRKAAAPPTAGEATEEPKHQPDEASKSAVERRPRAGARWVQPGADRTWDAPPEDAVAPTSPGVLTTPTRAGWVLPERGAPRQDAGPQAAPPEPLPAEASGGAPTARTAPAFPGPASEPPPADVAPAPSPFPAPQPVAAPRPIDAAPLFPPARPAVEHTPAVPFPWVEAALHPATVSSAVPATMPSTGGRRRGQLFSADMGAAAALTINLGLVAVMLGSFLTGISSHSFLGSSLISEFDRGFRYRLLAVFSQASFDQAVFIVVSIMLTVAVPAERPSAMRRTALYCASALGVFVAFGALLRAVALITFLGTAAALAVGSTVSALAAIPVAAAATAWAVVLLTRRSDETV